MCAAVKKALFKLLSVAITREKYIRKVCDLKWRKDLKKLKSEKVLLKKFNFVLPHCGLRTLKIVYRSGVFIGELLKLVGKSIERRKNVSPT